MNEYNRDSYWAKEAGKIAADNVFLKRRIEHLESVIAAIKKLPRHSIHTGGMLQAQGGQWVNIGDIKEALIKETTP